MAELTWLDAGLPWKIKEAQSVGLAGGADGLRVARDVVGILEARGESGTLECGGIGQFASLVWSLLRRESSSASPEFLCRLGPDVVLYSAATAGPQWTA